MHNSEPRWTADPLHVLTVRDETTQTSVCCLDARYKPKGVDSCFGNFPRQYKRYDSWDGNPTLRRDFRTSYTGSSRSPAKLGLSDGPVSKVHCEGRSWWIAKVSSRANGIVQVLLFTSQVPYASKRQASRKGQELCGIPGTECDSMKMRNTRP